MEQIVASYLSFISNPHFPCVAAKAAYARGQIKCFVAGNMACPASDQMILEFIYDFVEEYRKQKTLYHSATVIFSGPATPDEEYFDKLLWLRLQALADLDAEKYGYDNRVSSDPASPEFSFSLKEEALFVIGLHPANARLARSFAYPTIVFNPHQQFEILRRQNHYESMKRTVRKRDIRLSGSINPMLSDYGSTSEARQYSGREYDEKWQCPFHTTHGKNNHHSATERSSIHDR